MFVKKYFTLSLAVSLSLICGATFAQSSVEIVAPTNIHVPMGFDSNDLKVEVMVTGELPNTCYRVPNAIATRNGKNIDIALTATKINDKEAFCIMAVVPFEIPVDLGKLNQGNYKIRVNPGTDYQSESEIEIAKPSSDRIDNFNYANVTEVRKVNDTKMIALSGYHPSSCMQIDDIKVIPNLKMDTYSVLPIIRQASDVCDNQLVPFTAYFNLNLEGGKTLLHVRKIDGTALNKIIVTPKR